MLRLFSAKNFGPYHVLALATLGSLTQWIHLLADYQWGEEEPLLLFWSAFAITSLTKMAMFIAFPFMLAQAFATMQGNLRRCAIFTTYWAIALGSVVILLTVFRDPLCLLFSTDAARFYPVSNNYLGSYTELASWVGREAWLPRWRSGEVFLWESVLMAVIVASWGLLGYKTTAWFKPLPEALLACALPPPLACTLFIHHAAVGMGLRFFLRFHFFRCTRDRNHIPVYRKRYMLAYRLRLDCRVFDGNRTGFACRGKDRGTATPYFPPTPSARIRRNAAKGSLMLVR